ncbi:MAG: Prolipoprotein diacylglyceryl transferase [Geminicoccaceae bacterium]|jgi:phosphatidylglycerol:prolipoprotein diacylglycerol transferase|nr:Prolipoprotein diacylglyceryl transferase [Geminicoccaceae bacterium]
MNGATVVNPFVIDIGPLSLTGFGLAVLAAFAISQIIAQRELTRRGHDATAIPDLILAAVLGTLIGGKLYYTLFITHDIRDFFSRAGFVFWGGFIGSVIACYITIKLKKLNFTRISDVAGICIAAGYSVGRTGCWAVGDDYGRPWDGPLAVTFPEGAPPSTVRNMEELFGIPVAPGADPNAVVSVHPTQLYETVLGFVMFAILWRLRSHKHAEGWLFGLYLVLAGIERFLVEFLRAKDDRFFGPLTAAQVIALTLTALGGLWMAMRWNVGPGKPGIFAASRASAAVAR